MKFSVALLMYVVLDSLVRRCNACRIKASTTDANLFKFNEIPSKDICSTINTETYFSHHEESK